MSAFLSSADAINALATFWYNRHINAAETHLSYALARAATFAEPQNAAADAETVAQNKPFDAVFYLLLAENIRSLQHRYPSAPEMWATDETYRPRQIPCVKTWSKWKKSACLGGILRGYCYQSCEHEGWRTSVAHEICDQIKDELVADYQVALGSEDGIWACWTEPQD